MKRETLRDKLKSIFMGVKHYIEGYSIGTEIDLPERRRQEMENLLLWYHGSQIYSNYRTYREVCKSPLKMP